MCVTMCSLVMSPFSRDVVKIEIDSYSQYQQCFNLLTMYTLTVFNGAWFLDGRTSILVLSVKTSFFKQFCMYITYA